MIFLTCAELNKIFELKTMKQIRTGPNSWQKNMVGVVSYKSLEVDKLLNDVAPNLSLPILSLPIVFTNEGILLPTNFTSVFFTTKNN